MKETMTITFAGAQCIGKSRLMKEIKEKCSDNFDIQDSLVEHVLTARMRDIKLPKLRVWHIPQVPMKAFHVECSSLEEAVKIKNALADYDLFQYENNVKGDYANANGIQMWNESLTDQDLIDMELDDRWVDWYIEAEDEYFDDPEEYLEYLSNKA